jgi:hypothetical protein
MKLKIYSVVVTILFAIVLYLHAGNNPLPLPDNGSRIYVAANTEAQLATVEFLKGYGIQPRFRLDTKFAKRALLSQGIIINVPDPEFMKAYGNPGAGLALVVENPDKAATDAAAFFEAKGFKSRVIVEPEPEMPPNSMAMLESKAFNGWIIVFRKHIIHLPKPPDWE